MDVRCMCASAKFQADMLACVKAKCTPAELATAAQLEKEFCGTCAFCLSPSPVFVFCRWMHVGARVGC